jgi:AraC-like DNA-binding protein
MTLNEFATVFLNIASISLSGLAAHLLLSRVWFTCSDKKLSFYVPLAVLFIANAVSEFSALFMLPQVGFHQHYYSRMFVLACLPLHLVLAPLFWIYVRALTSESSITWRKRDSWHFLPFLMSLSLPFLMVLSDVNELQSLFDKQRSNTSLKQYAIALGVNIIEVSVLVQLTGYIALILHQLNVYRKTLVDLFASTELIELRWVRALAVSLIVYILISVVSATASNPFLYEPWESAIDLGLLWFIIVWGVRQKPGLTDEIAKTQETEKAIAEQYEHSGLTEGMTQAIAEKIIQCMKEERLYRNADLSLRMLAESINTLPNYVSQALNQHIGKSFFDFVNEWRVQEAKLELVDSNKTVLAISLDVGFNSRSSFYNAFKRVTGLTPSAFKKANIAQ